MKHIGLSLATAAALLAAPAVAHAVPITAANFDEEMKKSFNLVSDFPDVEPALNTFNDTFDVASVRLMNVDTGLYAWYWSRALVNSGEARLEATVGLASHANLYLLPNGANDQVFGANVTPSVYGGTKYITGLNAYYATLQYVDANGAQHIIYDSGAMPTPPKWQRNAWIPILPPNQAAGSFDIGIGTAAYALNYQGGIRATAAGSLDLTGGGQLSVDAGTTMIGAVALEANVSGVNSNLAAEIYLLDDTTVEGGRKAHGHASAQLGPASNDVGNPSICGSYDVGATVRGAGQMNLNRPDGTTTQLFKGIDTDPSASDRICQDLVTGQISHAPQQPASLPPIAGVDPSSGYVQGSGNNDVTITMNVPTSNIANFYFNGVPVPWFFCPSQYYNWCSVVVPASGGGAGPATISYTLKDSIGREIPGGSQPNMYLYKLPPHVQSAQSTSTGLMVTIDDVALLGGAVINVTSNDPKTVFAQTLTIPEGQSTQLGFVPATNPGATAEQLTLYFSSGGTSVSAPFNVAAAPPPPPLVLTTGADSEGGLPYNGSTTATVTLGTPAPAGDAVVALTSSDPSAIAVPLSITVPAGQTQASFTIKNQRPSVPEFVTLTATHGSDIATDSLEAPLPILKGPPSGGCGGRLCQ
jgi:hypothetical protein